MSAIRRSELRRLLRSQVNALALADADDQERVVLRLAQHAIRQAMDDLDHLDVRVSGQLTLDGLPAIYNPHGDAP